MPLDFCVVINDSARGGGWWGGVGWERTDSTELKKDKLEGRKQLIKTEPSEVLALEINLFSLFCRR